jgi:hypothetical protein
MDIGNFHSVWFVVISLVCALLGAFLFLSINAANPCRWSWAGIGAVLGLSLGPYFFSMFVMVEIENHLKEKERYVRN